jgi:hypothetical protein
MSVAIKIFAEVLAECLQIFAVGVVKGSKGVTIDVEHGTHGAFVNERNYNLGA